MKKIVCFTFMILAVFNLSAAKPKKAKAGKTETEKVAPTKNEPKYTVQVVNQENSNLSASESGWLPGQISDKLKGNLQEYLGMKIIVDSKAESMLKKLQAESESAGRDENDAIELGKISTAKYALFTKIRKTDSGYVVAVDFTDLKTGEQLASGTSKSYSKTEYLYSSTGAVDELTLDLASKLNIQLNDLTKALLTTGSAGFSVDQQLALAKQNEAQFKQMMSQYDAELAKLMTSNDINAVQNKNRIDAEKALLIEKQNAERKRQEELNAQKQRAEADAKLEAERSIALKSQRDQMAKDAAAKAAEVRKLKMEKQGVLGQINVIESKKKALVEIRQGVEVRSQELFEQLEKDRKNEELRIISKSYSTVELGGDGLPTAQAKKRRENQVIKSYEELTNKFFVDAESVKQSTMPQQNSLLAEIRADQKSLATSRTVSSMGDELKVSFGTYEGSQNGWNAYLSLYSDGVLLYTDNFIVNYEALSGKKAPNMATEMDDAVIEEYTNNVDMYNSLLTRGDPIIYFEIDYNVTAESDDKPSEYKFNFNKIRVINTLSGKVTQSSSLSKVQLREMKPECSIVEVSGIVAAEKEYLQSLQKFDNLGDYKKAVIKQKEDAAELKNFLNSFIKIPGKSYKMLKTEVTQNIYTIIMGYNPSYFEGADKPVECVSWYDAIYFCNKLSEKLGYTPVYTVNGTTDVTKWNYTPHRGKSIRGDVRQSSSANGFRLPTSEEWEYAARGGQKCRFSGSNILNKVSWNVFNSNNKTHAVAKKKANRYGLYDMSGNVEEWVWNGGGDYGYFWGGSYKGDWDLSFMEALDRILNLDMYNPCSLDGHDSAAYGYCNYLGFRIVCSASN